MPGKVVSILQTVGASVEKGDGVLVVEAMKMQNELKSPKAGVIKEIRVAEGPPYRPATSLQRSSSYITNAGTVDVTDFIGTRNPFINSAKFSNVSD
jgi:hypothetical protein